MRIGLLAALLALTGAPAAAADPPLPPIVFQAQPAVRVLDDIRAAADLIGGEPAVKAFNKGLEQVFGEKGLEGLDIDRPVVGYVVLAPEPKDITAVFALPVTGEAEFLDLCERANKQKPKPVAKEKGLYELPPLDPRYKALMRFSEGYAYIAYGFNPAPQLDPKLLVPMAKLYDPAERGLVAVRLHFDRIPLAVKLALPKLAAEVKKTLFLDGPGRAEELVVKAVVPEIEKLVARYVVLAAGADVLAARLTLDIPTGNLTLEATLNGKPDSELSKIIAAHKPIGNKFGGLLTHPDTVAGFKARLPLFEPEIRNAAVAGLDAGRKEAVKNVPEAGKAALEELFKGLGRTVKTGEFDLAGAVRGPDKNGWFTAVGAVAFEDPSKLEKEIKAFVKAKAPPGDQDAIEWDAAKAGTVNIHTLKLPGGGFLDFTKVFGGDDTMIAFAFAPHGIFAAIGPDAVATLTDALAVKPAASPVLDIVLNPDRVARLMSKVNPNDPAAAQFEKALGKEDKLLSALSVTLEGGKELKATLIINMRLLPRALGHTAFSTRGPINDDPEPVEKK